MHREKFKEAVGKYPTGVTVISTKYQDMLFGFTANSFASVSLDPAFISFCLNIKALSFNAFLNSQYFIVNILSSTQSELASHFASSSRNKFSNIEYKVNNFGVPIIIDALSFIECERHQHIECGDHYIFIGKVLNVKVNNNINNDSPLVYYAKSYMELK